MGDLLHWGGGIADSSTTHSLIFEKADFNKFKKIMCEIPWSEILEEKRRKTERIEVSSR